ncbi:MAG: FecR family protein [Pseudomonadales bacterium]|nr:FecR family protein [Pseudomonadales bacterium]
MKRVFATFLACAATSAVFSQSVGIADNEEAVARVVALSGEVMVEHSDGSGSQLARRSSIQVGDRIITTTDAWLQLRFVDNAILSLSCESELLVREYQYLDRNSDRSQLHLEKGKARTITGVIQRSNYLFTTEGVEIKPAGTDFEVVITETGSQYFGVYDGGIRISTQVGEIVIGNATQVQYAALTDDAGLNQVPLRPAQLGSGGLGGIECQ